MSLNHHAAVAATMAALMGLAEPAQAAFLGRDASGAASLSCTATGPGKCTYFYDTTLNITILNNWNIGAGFWSASAAPGSAQALAASAGQAASGLLGWVLPTGDGGESPGTQNQFKSIWNGVGGSFAGLSSHFDGTQSTNYWSSSARLPGGAWEISVSTGSQAPFNPTVARFAVAILPGDVAAAIPEPQTYGMMLLGLGAVAFAARRRRTH